MFAVILAAVAAVLAAAAYLFLQRRYSTWKRKGVPGPPASFLSLSVPKVWLGQESMGDVTDRIYQEYRDCPVAGTYMFGNPLLHLHDPEIIKQVLIKEFQDFSGRGVSTIGKDADPLASHLFFLGGTAWKNLRVKLAPTFTSGKIKYMFETIRQSSYQLSDYLDERIAAGGGAHCEDARPLMMRLFVDTISSVAFGIESNVVKNPQSEFYTAAKKAVEPSVSNALRSLLAMFGREIQQVFQVRSTNRETTKFFTEVVRESIEYRENKKIDRPDMLNLLIQLKNRGFVDADKADKDSTATRQEPAGNSIKLTTNDIAAQVFVFFIAGFESSSGSTSFTLYELAKQPKLLERVHQEVDQVLADHDGKITYEAIMSMPYLEMCINETLRMYAPLPFISREAMVTRKVPLTELTVEKGTRLLIPVRALHYDPVYWPDPYKYDPERHTPDKKATRPTAAYLPFGDGPRICIAGRLGMVQVKTALVRLLSKYTVSVGDNEPDKVPINPRSFATTPDIPLNVTFRPRRPADGIQKRHQSVASG
ncbi:Cytochrome P450 6k1 [Frankliniella fusca]|uniref:Cytochrome P450 6k1 n=1 Tax=Frankliniella fusca TaxID=407009 RepID=A0AAE1LAH5_9NEOP|nr:Cytochrome P450 6k1 [Frankliniella fusca]